MKEEKVCICGNPVECKGLTAGFSVLGDPRGRFARLPRHESNPSCSSEKERNERRAAYLRHVDFDILPHEDKMYVAIHHFHPLIVNEASSDRKFRKTVSKDLMCIVGIKGDQRDEILDEDGKPTGMYYFVPNYPIESAREDLKRLLRICKIVNTSPTKKKRNSSINPLLDLTNESERGSRIPEAAYVFEDSDSEEENSDSFLPIHLHNDNVSLAQQTEPNELNEC
jgi:hypothetical protein